METTIRVHFPDSIDPLYSGERFGPLSGLLENAKVGKMISIEPKRPLVHRSGLAASVDLELLVTDVNRAVEITKRFLADSGAPQETTLEICGAGMNALIPVFAKPT